MNSPFRNISIVGVGLIGGSFGLALKRRFRNVTVTGLDTPSVLRNARQRGAIDIAEQNLRTAVSSADIVLLACPTKTILRLLPHVARYTSPNTIVTDVGSVKSSIVRRGEKLFPAGNFIGGHPMAGVELSGIDAAHPLLLENAVYVLTPAANTTKPLLRRLARFLHALGTRVAIMDAETHDDVAAAVSHLPQLAAVALMNVVGGKHRSARQRLELAAGGFRDMTRIASSRFEMWNDILKLNSRQIDEAVEMLITELQRYRALLKSKKHQALRQHFDRARLFRNAIPKNMKGFLHTLSDLSVYVDDRPGELAKMTGALARAKINVKDVELMKVREGSGGTFRLSFETREIAQRAAQLLRKSGFEVAT
jgi:prephenate dehydrogenase